MSFDRTFVADIVENATPSVVLVMPRGARNSTAVGSGFAITSNSGIRIVTNAHVAAGGMHVEVRWAANDFSTPVRAKLIGRAPGGEDLALLALDDEAVEAASLEPLRLGDSDALRTGEFVVAMGHPAGLRSAATLGVLSGRSSMPPFAAPADEETAEEATAAVDNDGREGVPYLVTDAALAGGMSGGPLLNTDGEVVGVNTLVRPELRGLGNFAIASSRLKEVIDQIEEQAANTGGRARVGWRVVLFNDRFNRRQQVERALQAAGLNEGEARDAMMAAHTRGRGVVKLFPATAGGGDAAADEAAAAEVLRAQLAEADLQVEVEAVYARTQG